MTTVVALLANAGSGKTTAARYLATRHGAKIVSFAAPIKAIARDIYGWNDAHLYGELKEVVDPRFGISPRWFMQRLGCGARDHISQDLWLQTGLDLAASTTGLVVIDDCRFLNEARAVVNDCRFHGAVVKIVAPGRAQPVVDDVSEREIAMVPDSIIHATIDNGIGTSLEQLHQGLDAVVESLGDRRRGFDVVTRPGRVTSFNCQSHFGHVETEDKKLHAFYSTTFRARPARFPRVGEYVDAIFAQPTGDLVFVRAKS